VRFGLGPWVLERATGRPYFVRGYRLEPVAWVLRGAKGRVLVPMTGEARGRAWAEAWVRPVGVRVTEPGGRRRYLRLWTRTLWPMLAGAATVMAVTAVLIWLRHHSRNATQARGEG